MGIVVSLAADPVLFAVEGRVDRCLLLVDARGADWSDPAVLGLRIREPDDLPMRADGARARLGWGTVFARGARVALGRGSCATLGSSGRCGSGDCCGSGERCGCLPLSFLSFLSSLTSGRGFGGAPKRLSMFEYMLTGDDERLDVVDEANDGVECCPREPDDVGRM